MNVIFELTAFVFICWLLVSIFRLFVNMVEHFLDLSTQINTTRDNSEPLRALEPPVKIHSKAA